SITFEQTGNPSSPANMSTLNLNGGPVTMTTTNTSATAISVGPKVTVVTDNSMVLNSNSNGSIVNSGTISTGSPFTANLAGGNLTNSSNISSTGDVTLNVNGGTLTNNGTISSAASDPNAMLVQSTGSFTMAGTGTFALTNAGGSTFAADSAANSGITFA